MSWSERRNLKFSVNILTLISEILFEEKMAYPYLQNTKYDNYYLGSPIRGRSHASESGSPTLEQVLARIRFVKL